MPLDPAVVKPATQYFIRGAFSMVADEVRGHFRRKSALDGRSDGISNLQITDLEVDREPFASLDDARLGDGLAKNGGGEITLPADLFEPVVGLEYETRVLRRCATSSNPLYSHALLIGHPGSAKSLLLEELRRLPDTRYVVGRNMSPAGLIDMMVEGDVPRILLIDEIEKSDPQTLATLLTVMDGKATRAVSGKDAIEQPVDVRVIAAGNSTKGMNSALLSRFIELQLPEQTEAERRKVIEGFLVKRQGLSADDAGKIAALVAPKGGDTRDAAQIADMWGEDPELAKDMAKRLGRKRSEG